MTKIRAWNEKGKKFVYIEIDSDMIALPYKSKHGTQIFVGDIVSAEWHWTNHEIELHDIYDFIEYALDEVCEIVGHRHDFIKP